MGITQLHIHTEYSLLNSTCRINRLVETARQRNIETLAITDKNALYGVVPFYKACKKAGIHPVIGMEINIKDEQDTNRLYTSPFSGPTLVVLAKNNTGYQNLVALATAVQKERDQRLSREALIPYTDGLIGLSSGKTGDVEKKIAEGNYASARSTLQMYKNMFRDGFYMEIGHRDIQAYPELVTSIVRLAKDNNVPLSGGGPVHYISKEDAESFACLRAIQSGEGLKKVREQIGAVRHDLKTEDEIRHLFEPWPEALENARGIGASCRVDFQFNQLRMPKYPVPNNRQAGEHLREQCFQGVRWRYKEPNADVLDRLEHELDIIERMGYSDYFLIVWDLVRHARDAGIEPGPGRGSSAGSLVAYVLGITDVDPIKHGLLFERFLNPERISMPDIDIDFPDIRRDEVIAYTLERYGGEHVAQILTFGTLAARAAVRDVGRVLDVDLKDIDRLAKKIPGGPGVTSTKAVKESDDLKNMVTDDPVLQKVMRLAAQIEGLPRHTSIHAAGVVMSEQPLTDIVPLQPGNDSVPVTQFPMEQLEALGLLKMDFLGLRNLTLIESIVQLLKEAEVHIDVKSLPDDDPQTFELLSQGDTTGVFQLESSGMRHVLKKLKPTAFNDIVAVNALYRPGPMQFIDDYIAVKHGKQKVSYPHPDLSSILETTNGVLIYQEQIMKIAALMAGFSLGKADILRRAVSKKKRDELEAQREYFVKGCLKRGYTEAVAEEVYQLIVRFADYGFPRSHAVAYSVIAYRLAYLKAHYPAAFMAALLSSASFNHDKLKAYVSELKQAGINLYQPSVNHSSVEFSLEEDGIRYGLSGIKNLGHQAAQDIIRNRKQEPYKSLFDLCRRVTLKKVNRRALEALILAGAMDEFGVDRARLLATLDTALKEGSAHQTGGQLPSLFGEEAEDNSSYADVPPFSQQEMLRMEKETLGFYVSAHPVELYKRVLKGRPITALSNAYRRGGQVYAAILVETVKRIRTKKGRKMAILTISDPTGTVEAVVFPKVYEPLEDTFQEGCLLYVKGVIENGKKRQFIINEAAPLQGLQALKKRKTLYVRIDADHETAAVLQELKRLIKTHTGQTQVILFYTSSGKKVQLSEQSGMHLTTATVEQLKKLMGPDNVIVK